MSDQEIQNQTRLLRVIAEGTAGVTGEAFFRSLVRHLAEILEVRYAFVAEFADSHERVRTLAFWYGDDYIDNSEWDLAGSPCELVLAGQVCCYPSDIQRLFPHETDLVEMEAQSYLAVPLLGRQGEVLGHLAALGTEPMQRVPRDLEIFAIFAARAGAELQRLRIEQALRSSEARLTAVLASAMDAVVALDGDCQVTLFNPAAEKLFACPAQQVLGQSFQRFAGEALRQQLATRLALPQPSTAPCWLPSGMTALRADGVEFPIEITLSPLKEQGRPWLTLILRDINERHRAEAEIERLRQQRDYLQKQAGGDKQLIGESVAIAALRESIRQMAAADSTVLVLGESGVGKEMVAQSIHAHSKRRDKLLVKLNCAALPAELIESELFGHEKGAFTGATAQRKGRFELADGGVLFLDEVGELSLAAQAKLLRVLQEREFERVGGSRTIAVDVRLVAATNRDLPQMVAAGAFRQDLYYRLNVLPLHVPPLRERREDVPALARHFLQGFARRLGKPLHDFSAASLTRLQNYSWPGNVRELQNVIERAAVLCSGPLLDILPNMIAPDTLVVETNDRQQSLQEVERRHIAQVLQECGWVIEGSSGAAAILGLEPSTLRYRLRKLGLKRPNKSTD